MFTNLKIGYRLSMIVIVALIGMVSIASYGLHNLHENLVLDRKDKTKSIVEASKSVIADLHNQASKGEITEENARQRGLNRLAQIRYGKGDYVWVNDESGVFLAHPNAANVGKNFYDAKDPDGVTFMQEFVKVGKGGGGFVEYRWKRSESEGAVPKISYVEMFEPWGWIIGTGIYVDDVDTVFMDNLKSVGGMAFIILLVIGAVSFVIARGVTVPLSVTTGLMGRLAGGDKTIDVKFTQQHDEIGALARALEQFKLNAIEMDRLQAENEANKKKAEAERRALMLKMADDFENSVKGVVATVSSAATELQSNAQSMAAISEETSRQSTAVAAATEEASTNVHTVASAAEELNASIGEINRQIGDSVKVAAACVKEAESTSEVMINLDKSAENIGNVVKMIEDIASQVNLLALNATIEAARAGEAGRGFAVVATEVKNLANQAANAAQDITNQITDVQTQTKSAVGAISGITETIKRVNEISTAIASAVEEQGAATKEIARNVQQASQGTDEVTRNISGVTRAAQEAGSASNQVLTAAQQLSKESETLRSVVDTFISKVRAG